MKNNIKNTFILLLITSFVLLSCGKNEDEDSAKMYDEVEMNEPANVSDENENLNTANPMQEVSESELLENTGFDLQPLDGAENISRYVIDGSIADLRFDIGDSNFTYRVTSTADLDVNGTSEISGLNYDWDDTKDTYISYCEAICEYNSSESLGHVKWLDVVPGVMYDLSVTNVSSCEDIESYASQIFVPLQGDVDGDEIVEDEFDTEELINLDIPSESTEEIVEVIDVNNFGDEEELVNLDAAPELYE